MKYLFFKSRAEFFRTDLPDTFFMGALIKVRLDDGNWAEIKPLIMHKDCPDRFRKPFTQSDKWYIRLTAMLNKYSWKTYILEALKDPKSTVRAAAVKRILNNIDESPISPKELIETVRKDKGISKYINTGDIYEFLVNKYGEIDLK